VCMGMPPIIGCVNPKYLKMKTAPYLALKHAKNLTYLENLRLKFEVCSVDQDNCEEHEWLGDDA